jgi:hypothetical protein
VRSSDWRANGRLDELHEHAVGIDREDETPERPLNGLPPTLRNRYPAAVVRAISASRRRPGVELRGPHVLKRQANGVATGVDPEGNENSDSTTVAGAVPGIETTACVSLPAARPCNRSSLDGRRARLAD